MNPAGVMHLDKPKPILTVQVPEEGREFIDETCEALDELKKDYYVIVYVGKSEEMKFNVFWEKDFDHVKYEELKAIIKESIKP